MLREISRVLDQIKGKLQSPDVYKKSQLRWVDTKLDRDETRYVKEELKFENKGDYNIALYPLEFDRNLRDKDIIYIISTLNGAYIERDRGKLVFKSFQIPGNNGKIVVAKSPTLGEVEALDILFRAVDLSEPLLARAKLPVVPYPHRNVFTLKR